MSNFKWAVYYESLSKYKQQSFQTLLLKQMYVISNPFNNPNEIKEKILTYGDYTDEMDKYIKTYKIWFGEMSFFEACLFNQNS